ncbi:MAG: 50S ribosomal protein L21 [Pricia sp.]
MYAIVEMAGQQFKVAKDQKVYVHRLQTEEGKKVTFDNVLLLGDGSDITIGAPAIDGALVEAKVVRHLRGDKVIVFKKKRRKGYRKKNGHRQSLTEILIEGIVSKDGKKADKKEEAKKDDSKKAAPAKDATTASKKDSKDAIQETKGKSAPVDKSVASKPEKKEASKAKKDAEPKKDTDKKASVKKASGKADDLKKIEGIGPKTAEALNEAGMGTFAKLAKADPEKIKEILAEASSNLAHLDPGTWPEQAQLAADGKWDELEKWQDELDGGKK